MSEIDWNRIVRILLRMKPEQARRFIASLTPRDVLRLDAAFEAWAQKGQLPPSSDGWRTWLMLAGRGFGKTRAGAEWVNSLAVRGNYRFALVAASLDEARQVMVEGRSGLLAVNQIRDRRIKWEPSLGKLTWPSGSEAKLFSGDSPDGLRGPEHHFAWCAAADRPAAGGGD